MNAHSMAWMRQELTRRGVGFAPYAKRAELERLLTHGIPGRCEAQYPGAFGDWLPMCDQPATETWQYACIHEHVKTGRTCTRHRPQPGDVGCKECFDAGHLCDLTAIQVNEEAGNG